MILELLENIFSIAFGTKKLGCEIIVDDKHNTFQDIDTAFTLRD
jgi:translation elongation factor EF-1beta